MTTDHGPVDLGPIHTLEALETGASRADATAFFDACPPVSTDEMIGCWKGGGLPTGHPMDGMLEATGWHGKRFDSADNVHPLVFGDSPDLFSVDPALLPMGSAMRFRSQLDNTRVQAIGRRALRLAETTTPAARLRMMEYRGVVTATMSYDALPINDHFRRVDDDTVIGAMDLRGSRHPFFFTLRREPCLEPRPARTSSPAAAIAGIGAAVSTVAAAAARRRRR